MQSPIILMYHDVVINNDFASSGLQIPRSEDYKIDLDEFKKQMEWITNYQIKTGKKVELTFDDGGKSAIANIMPILKENNLQATFFIPTNFIGKPGFLTIDDIKELSKKNFIIGSHSHTHPAKLSHLPISTIVEEWKTSIEIIKSIVNQPIINASVPGGWYSRQVATAASESDIENLFTSNPTQKVSKVGETLVFGRYAIKRGHSINQIQRIIDSNTLEVLKTKMKWQASQIKKIFIQ